MTATYPDTLKEGYDALHRMSGVAGQQATKTAQAAVGTQHRRIRGLDGLRAIAAFVVLGYHVLPGSFQAGFIGVDIFFVISGFLITALLLKEHTQTGTFSLPSFWMRRIRRLFPAVLVATFGSIALARIVGGDAIVQLPWQAFGSLTATYNWLEIANGSSYFAQRSPLLLTNMWSLAVEQQFYLVWPVLLLLVLAFVPRRARPWSALGVAALSAGAHALIVSGAADATRAYVGTDTHAFGLMIGAALAFAFPHVMSGDLAAVPDAHARAWRAAGWLALLSLIALAVCVPDSRFMYPWGMVAASLLSAVVVRALLPDVSGRLSGLLNSRPLVWLGERSYGVYLWHWPLWVCAFYALHWDALPAAAAVVAASVLCADLSYRYVESPIRHEHFMPWVHRVLATTSRRALIAIAVCVVIVFSLFTWAVAASPAQSSAERYVAAGQQALNGSDATSRSQPESSTAAPSASTIAGDSVTLIGDSVALAAAPALQEKLPGIVINAEVSRQATAFPAIAQQLASAGELRDYVVVALATNGTIRQADAQAILDAVGSKRKIVFVTGYGPATASWISEANRRIWEIAKAHPEQVRVADWAAIAAAHQDLLAGDRVHPGPAGGELYADTIVKALNSW